MMETRLTQRGLERRIKRHLKNEDLSFAAITVPGFEAITRQEIEGLQPDCVTGSERGIVEFHGSMELLYNASLYVRTANRFLLRIERFTVRSYPELYNKASRIEWERYSGFAEAIALNVTSRTSRLHHTENIASTVFDAVHHHLEQLNVKVHRVKDAPITFFVRFFDDVCTVSADATGTLLYKRGRRTATGRAPLRETTAAALLYAASWENYRTIADPCCGTGGIILEALQMVGNYAAGIDRDFAFFSWPSFNPAVWERLKKKALEKKTCNDRSWRLVANDIDASALRLLEKNAAVYRDRECLPLEIVGGNCLTFNQQGEYGDSGLLISNLPFGKRILTSETDCTSFYRKLGGWLRRCCRGWNFAFLVADPLFESKAGLKCTTAIAFDNGGIPVRLVMGKVE
jgi:putative N6-adenine-specific DNA methylase